VAGEKCETTTKHIKRKEQPNVAVVVPTVGREEKTSEKNWVKAPEGKTTENSASSPKRQGHLQHSLSCRKRLPLIIREEDGEEHQGRGIREEGLNMKTTGCNRLKDKGRYD